MAAMRKYYLDHEIQARSAAGLQKKRIREGIVAQWGEMNTQQQETIVRRIKRAIDADELSIAAFASAEEADKEAKEVSPDSEGFQPEMREEWLLRSQTASQKYMESEKLASARWKSWNLVTRTKERLPEGQVAPKGKAGRGRRPVPRNPPKTGKERSMDDSKKRAKEAEDCLEKSSDERERILKMTLIPLDVPVENGKRKLPEDWAGKLDAKRLKTKGKKAWYRQTPIPDIPTQYGISGNGTGAWEWQTFLKNPRDDGSVSLWLQRSPHTNLIEGRLVMKEVLWSDNTWHDQRKWAYARDDDNATRLPWELECQRQASMMTSPQYIVPLMQTKSAEVEQWVDNSAQRYRVFMEYCGHKDLIDVILHYPDPLDKADGGEEEMPQLPVQKKGSTVDVDEIESNGETEDDSLGQPPGTPESKQQTDEQQQHSATHIPEPMIWHVAESLARFGIQMTQDMPNSNGGRELVHRDLTPQNIFLDTPHDNIYPHYPSIKVGDFEWAILTSATDSRNPEVYAGLLTPGYQAPEMALFVNYENMQPMNRDQMLEKCNVWQIGAILRSLVLRDQAPPQSLYLGSGDEDETYKFWTVSPRGSVSRKHEMSAHYSFELLELIERCMSYRPGERCDFRAMLGRVRELTGSGGGGRDLARGMRRGNVTKKVADEEGLIYGSDEFKVGTRGGGGGDDDGDDGDDDGGL